MPVLRFNEKQSYAYGNVPKIFELMADGFELTILNDLLNPVPATDCGILNPGIEIIPVADEAKLIKLIGLLNVVLEISFIWTV